MAFAVSLSTLATAASGAAAESDTHRIVVKPARVLVVLLVAHTVTSAADDHALVLEPVGGLRPITGERTVLPLIGRTTDADGVKWLRVLLPGRPNGHTGWIHARATRTALTRWHILIDISSRQVSVYRDGHIVRVLKAVVGKASTPTPHGNFFIEESIALAPTAAGAPFALALSARSDALRQFAGGPGQIALHGLMNLGGTPGTAVSHGCIRLDNAAIRWLARRVGPGVPVTITG